MDVPGCMKQEFNPKKLTMRLGNVLVGKGPISNGVLESISYDKDSDTYILSHSTATSPTQYYDLWEEKRLHLHPDQRTGTGRG